MSSCTIKDTDPRGAIVNILMKYKSSQSISYDLNFYQQFFSGDSIRLKAKVDLIKNTQDSIVGGKLWYKVENPTKYDKYYDLNSAFDIDHSSNTITSYKIHEDQEFILIGNTDSYLKNIYFFNGQETLIEEITNNSINCSITSLNKNLKVVSLNLEDRLPYKNLQIAVTFNIKDDTIDKITSSADFQSQTQKQIYHITNTTFNENIDKSLELTKRLNTYLQDYSLKEYQPQIKSYEALPNNSIIPAFTGKSIISNKTIDIKDELKTSKLILLDFWYSNCYPCIQSFPTLNRLSEKYKNKGLKIIGLNPFDLEMPKDKMNIFLKDNPIKYQSLFINDNTIKDLKIKVYPTIYIINNKGEIKYSHLGLEKFETIDSIISSHLNIKEN